MTTVTRDFRTATVPESARAQWRPPMDAGLRECGWALLCAILISLPVAGIGGWIIYRDYAVARAARLAFAAALKSHDRLVAAPPLEMLPVDRVVHGRTLFENSCAACHKADGTGIDGLGKNLTVSWFVASRDDALLSAFITRGRAPDDPLNTTKVPMPPKGGHDELSDADLSDIVTYVRGLQDPRRLPPLPPSATVAAPAAPTEADKAQALAAAGGDAELAGYIAHGTVLFAGTCSACHGKDAKGLPNLGKDLVHSTFCKSLDDDALLAFVKRGRDPSDPANTTKVGMPPRGGNPALSDDDLLDVIAYVRTLQKQASATQ